ncbi:MAG: SDR family NAD(P)-dependent oxidoreductase [Hyphomicrobiales bacterium]
MPVLDGKHIVVTGAGRGLGRAYALDAARHGAAVVVNDIDEEACAAVAGEIRESGGKAVPFAGSVADWQLAGALIALCVREFGRIDGLVANAGLYYATPPWEDTEERIRRVIEVNLAGAIFCNVHALQAMVEQRSGAIVNISSGSQAGMANIATYGATKGALASYTYSAALDCRSYNVRVNAVSPLASTRMGAAPRGALSDTVADDPAVRDSIRERGQAMGRPEDIAPLVTFLLSDLAAGITGQVVRLQDGRLSLFAHPAVMPSHESARGWTPETIAAAFERSLAKQLNPVAFGEGRYIGPGEPRP